MCFRKKRIRNRPSLPAKKRQWRRERIINPSDAVIRSSVISPITVTVTEEDIQNARRKYDYINVPPPRKIAHGGDNG